MVLANNEELLHEWLIEEEQRQRALGKGRPVLADNTANLTQLYDAQNRRHIWVISGRSGLSFATRSEAIQYLADERAKAEQKEWDATRPEEWGSWS